MKNPGREFKKSCKIGIISSIISSCVSYDSYRLKQISPGEVPFPTHQCQSIEGGVAWKVTDGDRSLEGQADWISDHEGGWAFEVVDPWGQVHGSARYSKFTPLEVLPKADLGVGLVKGFFNIDGHRVAIKPEEVPCILHGSIPLTWLKQMKQRPKGSWVYQDGKRKIIVREKPWGWKVKIKWPVLWGFWSQHLLWKIPKDVKKSSEIKVNEFEFSWRRFEG